MKYKIFTKEDLTTTTWQGGTTTQLYIYPENASYVDRNFDFRISTAKVELEKSEFTTLPNINRKLMILEGAIEIIHENQYRKKLNKFDVDTFNGSWKTSAIGTCTDFNLMTTKHTQGSIKHLIAKNNTEVKTTLLSNTRWLILYLNTGLIVLHNKKQQIELKEKEIVVIEDYCLPTLTIKGIETSEIIITEIS